VKEKKVKMRQDDKTKVKYKMMEDWEQEAKDEKVDEDVKEKENDGEDGSRNGKEQLKRVISSKTK
jgi:hypothetical protein